MVEPTQRAKRVWGEDFPEDAVARVELAGVWLGTGWCGVVVLAMGAGGESVEASAGGQRF